MFLANVFMFRN